MKIYSAQLDYLEEIQKAESGDAEAMVRVAFAILHGNKTDNLEPEEAERAIRYYKTAAEMGNKSAMMDLGACYMDGRGVERNVEEAIKWYERGWDLDDPGACFCLGCISRYDYLVDGTEVPTADPDRIEKAMSYFRRGAELDDCGCLYELGELYLSGTVCEADPEKAFQLFESSVEEHDLDVLSDRVLRAYLRLAECWHYGIGTGVNLEEAMNNITFFRSEYRRRRRFGETEEDTVLKRAEKEWIAINRDLDKKANYL